MILGMAALLYGLWPHRGGNGDMGDTVAITPDNFEEQVLLSREPVLAYFWAPW